jgi:hypothetical protein
MATLASAQEKLSIKQRAMPENYNESMGDFFGVSASQIASSPAGRAYAAKVADPDMPGRWARNLRRAFGL